MFVKTLFRICIILFVFVNSSLNICTFVLANAVKDKKNEAEVIDVDMAEAEPGKSSKYM